MNSLLSKEIIARTTTELQVIRVEILKARWEHKAVHWPQYHGTLQQPDPPTQDVSFEPPMLAPDVDETVTYFQQETGEWIDFIVLGIRRCKEGIHYTVAYAGNEDTEVELSEHEMEDILNQTESG